MSAVDPPAKALDRARWWLERAGIDPGKHGDRVYWLARVLQRYAEEAVEDRFPAAPPESK